jgi:hypothetical protein
MLHENWPMIAALAVAVAIGWLVFTVLRPSPAMPNPARGPPQMVSSNEP